MLLNIFYLIKYTEQVMTLLSSNKCNTLSMNLLRLSHHIRCQKKEEKITKKQGSCATLKNREPLHAYLRAWDLEASTGITFSFGPF